MKISTQLGYAGGFHETVAEVREFVSGLMAKWQAQVSCCVTLSLMEQVIHITECSFRTRRLTVLNRKRWLISLHCGSAAG